MEAPFAGSLSVTAGAISSWAPRTQAPAGSCWRSRSSRKTAESKTSSPWSKIEKKSECGPAVIGVAAVSRAVPDAKPVPSACSAVSPVEPGEFTLMTLPPESKAKLLGAATAPPGAIQFELSSSAMKPSLKAASPGASSVRKRNETSAQFTPSGTRRLSRSVVGS